MDDAKTRVFEDSLYNTPELLDEAVQKVKALEGSLGTKRPGKSKLASALATLNDDKVEISKPDVFRITDNSFYKKKFQVPVDLADTFANHVFLYVEFPVGLKTRTDWSFNRYRLMVEFADKDVKVIDILPSDKFKEIIKVKGSFQVGIDTSLNFRAATPDIQLTAAGAGISGKAEAGLDSGSNLSFIKPPFEYSIKQWDIKTEGKGLYYIDWEFFSIDENTKQESRDLRAILRVPKSANELVMNATLVAYRNPDSFGGALTGLFNNFSETLQSWFKKGVPMPFHDSRDLLADNQQEI